jgi:hypothetical protein
MTKNYRLINSTYLAKESGFYNRGLNLSLHKVKQSASQLTPTTLRWSTLSPPLAQRGLFKFFKKF